MAGFYVEDAYPFEEWLLLERERLRNLALQALHQLVTQYVRRRQADKGVRYARQLLRLEPWIEEGHRALMRLLAETPKLGAWFSFSCQNGRLISDGTPIAACAKLLDKVAQVHAIGINCTAPRHIPSLIQEVRRVTQKPIVVYPNSGEEYDPVNKVWLGESVPAEFGTYSREWRKLGAAAIGGCCRTTPAHIRQIRDRFWHRGVAG